MGEALFNKRRENLKDYGELTAFNVALVAMGLDIIRKLSEENAGTETVEQRIGEFKSWDPEIFRVDKDVEDAFRKMLPQLDHPMTLFSEEAGRVEINQGKKGEKLFGVADPFDGSYLFKRDIPDFWYSSMAFFNEEMKPLSCAVGDGVHRDIVFANDESAYLGKLEDDTVNHILKLDSNFRKSAGRDDVTDLKEASIESYGLKPKKFLLPLVDKYRSVLEPFKFFLPNAGPYGFADVAMGKIDVYFAFKQPFVDVFSGILIAQKSGIFVTDIEGNDVVCPQDDKTVHDVVVSTNRKLHDKVLDLIQKSQ
jgi:fructose-1,6-bisphosphatase/inositol monophosphatase family enzyme